MKNRICILFLFFLIIVGAKAQYSYNIQVQGKDTSFVLKTPEGLPQKASGRYLPYDEMKYGKNGFEQNKLLSIKNIGTNPVENLRFTINKDELVYSYKELLDKIDLSGLVSIDDTLKALHKFISDWHIPSGMVSTNGENGGSNWIRKIQSYNVFGAGDCGNNSQILRGMLTALGYKAKVFTLQNYHAVVFVFANDGRTIFLDGHYRGLYTNRYNDSLADIKEMLDDADIIRRQRHLTIEFSSLPQDYMTRAFTGNCWRVPAYLTDEIDSIKLIIQPNEEFRFLYDTSIPEGKHSYYNHTMRYPTLPPPPTAAKGEQITNVLPDSTASLVVENANGIKFINSDEGVKAVLDTKKASGNLLLHIQNPFVITDADIFYRAKITEGGSINFNYGADTNNLQPVQTLLKDYNSSDSINLFNYILPQDLPMLNDYYVQINFVRDSLTASSPELSLLRVRTIFQFNPNAIPKLDAGENSLRLQSSNNDNVHVQLSMQFQPQESVSLPEEVHSPVFPADGQNLQGSKFKFKWMLPSSTGISSITDYRVQVSDRKDFKTLVSSTFDHFDTTIEQSQFGVFQIPQNGLIQPDKIYYWRVAYRRNDGVWSNWSPSWNFTVSTPTPPHLAFEKFLSDRVIIKLTTQSQETIPVKYILRGSNKLGFKWEDGILIDTLKQDVIQINGKDPNRIFSFYRAVTVDANGIESGPSEPLAFGYGNFLAGIDTTIKAGDTTRIKIVSPDAYLEWLTFDGVVRVDTFRTSIARVRLPEGFEFDGAKEFFGKANAQDSVCSIEAVVTAPATPQNIFYNTPYQPQTVNKEFALHIRQNNLPSFVSKPTYTAKEDSFYSYKACAIDADSAKGDDLVRYHLRSPGWMSIDSITGEINGVPGIKNLSDTVVSIEAYDLWGGITTQRFTVNIKHVNHAPNIVSSPLAFAKEDTLYSYRVVASDVDTIVGDFVRFKLLISPEWLTIDTLTGDIAGKPGRRNIGDTVIVVAAEDSYKQQVLQQFQLRVLQSYFPPSPIKTVDPQYDDVLSLPSKEMTFVWSRPTSYYDSVWYSFHLRGNGIDTIIRNIHDTTITLTLDNRLRENEAYTWWVVVRDGRSRVVPEDTSRFYVKQVTTAADNYIIPNEFILWQNFPNPFKEATTIRFGLPEDCKVYVDVLNLSGRSIVTLQQGQLRSGTYTIKWTPLQLLPGMYVLRMKTTSIKSGKKQCSTIKMLYVR